MRTLIFFDEVSASASHISNVFEIPCGQDIRFLIQATKTNTNGNPRLIIEESIDNTIWTALEDTETWQPYTELIDVTGIKDSYFMGAFMRVRLEPNGTTTGTITAKMGYKSKV